MTVSSNWFLVKVSGKPYVWWLKKQWFPVDFPFNQSIDCHDFPKTFGIITCFEHSQVMWVLVFVIQPFQITQPKYIYNSRFMIYNCSTNLLEISGIHI